MYQVPRIPELARRERFIRRAAAERVAFAVSDGREIARVDAHGHPPAPVALVWSTRHEAERWADVLAQRPQIVEVGLGRLLDQLLPELAERGIAVGLDWTCDTVEPEIEPTDLAGRLRMEMLEIFVHRVHAAGRMWILEGPDGPARLAGHDEGTVALACWGEASLAEAAAAGEWSGMRVLEIPLDGFRDMTVPWLDSRGWKIAAEPASAVAAAEIAPATLLQRLSRAPGSA